MSFKHEYHVTLSAKGSSHAGGGLVTLLVRGVVDVLFAGFVQSSSDFL